MSKTKGKKSKRKAVSSSKKNLGKTLVIYTSIIILLFVALFLINRTATEEGEGLQRVDDQPAIVNQPFMGSESAKVTLVEFGDYKCPACKAWGERIYPRLKEQYIDTGKVKLVYVNTLFHGEESELGAMAAESVYSRNAEAFWPFHEALFKAQPNEDHDGLWITDDKVLEIAGSIAPQIDLKQLKSDIANKQSELQIQRDNELIKNYKVKQTPTIMINGLILPDPFDIENIKSVIEQELGG